MFIIKENGSEIGNHFGGICFFVSVFETKEQARKEAKDLKLKNYTIEKIA